MILGASKYVKIKTKAGELGEPIAEFKSIRWTIMSPGAETNLSNQQVLYSEFQQQLVHHPEGWYETGLQRKDGHPPPPNNHKGNLARLSNLMKKLQKVPSHLDE